MTKKTKFKIALIFVILFGMIGGYVYFKYFFTYEQRNRFKRNIEAYTGQNLTITIFSYEGKIIKRWKNIQKITSGEGTERNYTYFYTSKNKYVQIPNSVWYLAEEE